jgi:hypothetical protein
MVAAGDGDDSAVLFTSIFDTVTGGSGTDFLRTTSPFSQARLSGNDGHDTLHGGRMASLFGRIGDDVLSGLVFRSGERATTGCVPSMAGRRWTGAPGRQRRRRCGHRRRLSKRQLAERSGLSERAVVDLERGSRVPSRSASSPPPWV